MTSGRVANVALSYSVVHIVISCQHNGIVREAKKSIKSDVAKCPMSFIRHATRVDSPLYLAQLLIWFDMS